MVDVVLVVGNVVEGSTLRIFVGVDVVVEVVVVSVYVGVAGIVVGAAQFVVVEKWSAVWFVVEVVVWL